MNKYKFLILGSVAVGMLSCGGPKSTKTDNSGIDTASSSSDYNEIMKGKQILYSLPSPVEAAALLKSSGAKFDINYLNATAKVGHYASNTAKALNLGVYATDLIFANIFGQTQASADYFKCANSLGVNLGITDAFGEGTFKRMKANMDNKDSLMSIIAEASLDADAYFKENERPDASALVATGGWIEGIYIASKIAASTNNAGIINRVAEQKNSLNNLLALVEGFEKDKEVVPVVADLKSLKSVFDGLQVKEDTQTPTPAKGGPAMVGAVKHLEITPEQLKAICDKVEQIRNNITK